MSGFYIQRAVLIMGGVLLGIVLGIAINYAWGGHYSESEIERTIPDPHMREMYYRNVAEGKRWNAIIFSTVLGALGGYVGYRIAGAPPVATTKSDSSEETLE